MSTASNNDLQGLLNVSVAASSAAVSSSVQTNPYGRGLKVFINAVSASVGSFTVTVQGVSSGIGYTVLTSAAIIAPGLTVLTVYPGVAAVANVSGSDVIPRQFQVTLTPTGFTGIVNVSACVIV